MKTLLLKLIKLYRNRLNSNRIKKLINSEVIQIRKNFKKSHKKLNSNKSNILINRSNNNQKLKKISNSIKVLMKL